MPGTAVTYPDFPPASPADVSVHPLTTMRPDRSFSLSPAAPLFGQPFLWQPEYPHRLYGPFGTVFSMATLQYSRKQTRDGLIYRRHYRTLFSGERKRIHSSGLNIRASNFRTNPARGSTLVLYNLAPASCIYDTVVFFHHRLADVIVIGDKISASPF